MNDKEDIYGKFMDKIQNNYKLNPVEEAMANDKRLDILVAYQLSEGYMKTLPIYDGIETAAEFAKQKSEYIDKAQNLFQYFKKIVLDGEITINQLEDKVYSKYGIVSSKTKKEVNPVLNGINFMSEKEYEVMRESYNGQDTEE